MTNFDDGLLTSPTKFVQKAVILHPRQELILALQRPPDPNLYNGPWDLPGGKVQYGENHLLAIQREISEETGLDVANLQLHWFDTFMNDKRGLYYIFVGYQCRALSEDVFLSDEHFSYQWLAPHDFLRLPSTPFLQNLVRQIFQP